MPVPLLNTFKECCEYINTSHGGTMPPNIFSEAIKITCTYYMQVHDLHSLILMLSAANIVTILNIRKHNQQNFILTEFFIDFIC